MGRLFCFFWASPVAGIQAEELNSCSSQNQQEVFICGSWRNDSCHLSKNFYTGCGLGVCAWVSKSHVSFFLPSLPHHHFFSKTLICEGISVPFLMHWSCQIYLMFPPSPLWCEIWQQKAAVGGIDTEFQFRAWFGVFGWTGTFSWACGVGKNSACGHCTCSLGRNLECLHSFNLRIRLYLLFLGFGLALKGIKPSHLKFCSAVAIRSAWSTQKCSLSTTWEREINLDLVLYKLSKIQLELEDLIVNVLVGVFQMLSKCSCSVNKRSVQCFSNLLCQVKEEILLDNSPRLLVPHPRQKSLLSLNSLLFNSPLRRKCF